MTYRRLRLPASIAVTALLLTACGSGFESDAPSSDAPESEAPGASTAASAAAEPGAPLTILIGSSGDAETDIVNQLVADWSAETGTEAEVVVASDLNQQLSQGFSSNNPPDLFYLSTDQMQVYAATDSLEPYAESLSNADDFYGPLREAFT
jgi:multiple sugar transport system substrate-binding protein